jgi:hypothetical protein
MNLMFVLIAICLLCAALALYTDSRIRAKARQKTALQRVAETSQRVLRHYNLRDADILDVHNLTRKMMLLVSAIVCVSLPCLPANAQEVIHAQAGQVVAINPAAKTLTLKAADGSQVLFQDVADPEPKVSFDKAVRDKTVPAGTFSKVGANVVVFYFGFDTQVAVAVKELGPVAPVKSTGSVANFDRHLRLLTLKTEASEPQKLVLSDDTVVDTSQGIVKLADYRPSKGDQVRWFTKPESPAVLFVAAN